MLTTFLLIIVFAGVALSAWRFGMGTRTRPGYFHRNLWEHYLANSLAIIPCFSWRCMPLRSRHSSLLPATITLSACGASLVGRGLALPILQRKFAPVWAGLILGAIWGLWHMPAFLLSGTQQSEWSFTSFFAGCLAISVIATALFNRSRGSILLSAFFHFSLMNPIFPDAQPYDTYMLVIAAILIVWWNRKNMFTREASVTEVIPSQNYP